MARGVPSRSALVSILLIIVASLLATAPGALAEEVSPVSPPAAAAEAQDEGPPKLQSETTRELAKAAQNPIADLVSLPIRNTINFNASPEHNKIQDVTTLIPTIPMRVTENWNIIFRTTIPILYQPALTPGASSEFGVSDINLTAYVARSESRTLIWGLGPTLLLPTAMERTLGTGKWSAGPSVALVAQPGSWVLGFLMYNLWSFAGYDDRASVNQFLLQTFVNYNLPKGWYLCTAPFLSANWKLPMGERWMVPAGGGFGKIIRTKSVIFDLQTQAFYYVRKPRSEAEWSLLFQLKFLFPKTALSYHKAGDHS